MNKTQLECSSIPISISIQRWFFLLFVLYFAFILFAMKVLDDRVWYVKWLNPKHPKIDSLQFRKRYLDTPDNAFNCLPTLLQHELIWSVKRRLHLQRKTKIYWYLLPFRSDCTIVMISLSNVWDSIRLSQQLGINRLFLKVTCIVYEHIK